MDEEKEEGGEIFTPIHYLERKKGRGIFHTHPFVYLCNFNNKIITCDLAEEGEKQHTFEKNRANVAKKVAREKNGTIAVQKK